ncbi:MAG: 50S ribosome-binding GTPase [Erysipelotrichaceae bacterium]|nr:50S ribosome-binding GTPase [Erysipelotrichaceae bacterium]
MKKCKGCGVTLQIENPRFAGYVKSFDQDYCQRCFRLTHYGDSTEIRNELVDNSEILKLYKEYKEDIFVLIIDAFDFLSLDKDDLLNYYKNNKLLVVINKIDLLPRSVKDDKLEDLFKDVLSRCITSNILGCLLTYKGDYTFKDLFFEAIKEFDTNRFVFAGRVNAGKTTIINKLLGNNDLTVSTYPGTTVSTNLIEIDKYTFIDTPGLIDEHSFINKLDKDLLKDLIPNKTVKPKVFQFYEPESYIIDGLIRFDVIPKRNASITFYIKNELEVHRTKCENADNYINKHQNEFKLKLLPFKSNAYKVTSEETYYLKGLGYIRVKGNTNVKIYVNESVLVYKCGVKI